MSNASFQDHIEESRKNIARFEKIEGKPWGVEGSMIELAKQVGELSKLVMVQEGYYFPERAQEAKYTASKEQIGDELADILYAIVRIAKHYDIDLAAVDIAARKQEDEYLKSRGI
jgi:NTP pyrophosphatase (non-canonical NTP hydrolase)